MSEFSGSWSSKNAVVFHVNSTLQNEEFSDAYLVLRTNSHYPYQELSLSIVLENLKSKAKQQENIRVRVTDPRGRWKGKGFGEVKELHYFYRKLPAGSYRVAIVHKMPREVLPGIEDLGMKLKTVSSSDGK